MRSLRVERRIVDHLRCEFLRTSRHWLRTVLLESTTPGRETFSLRSFLWSHRRHPRLLWRALAPLLYEAAQARVSPLEDWMSRRLPAAVTSPLRKLKAAGKRLLTRDE